MSSKVSKEDLVLYSLNRLLEPEYSKADYTREHLFDALGISSSTLDHYLTQLKQNGYLIRHKKKYSISLADTLEITGRGRRRYLSITDEINSKYLTPENHNIQVVVPLGIVLERIKNPLEEILFLSLYNSLKTFDLDSYLKMMKDLRVDSNMVRVLSDLQEDNDQENLPSAGTFFRACFFGDIIPERILEDEACYGNVFDLLLIAEANHKQGRLDQADSIYEHLLSGKVNLTENQWVIARLGSAMTLFKRGKSDEAIQLARSVLDSTNNKIMISYGKQVIARILSSSGRVEEALELYNTAVRSFDNQGIPLLSCIAHNNRGVAYYRLKNVQRAIDDWEKAIKYAKEAGSGYSEAAILTNIADIESSRGNVDLALEYIRKSYDIFEQFEDLEGLSLTEFNHSLVLLDRKDLEGALDHYRRGDRVALPLPIPYEREERKRDFMERARKNGFEDLDESVLEPDLPNETPRNRL